MNQMIQCQQPGERTMQASVDLSSNNHMVVACATHHHHRHHHHHHQLKRSRFMEASAAEEPLPARLGKKRRIGVRFCENPEASTRVVPNRDDYSVAEKDATWYSDQEMVRVKYETLLSIKLLNTTTANNNNNNNAATATTTTLQQQQHQNLLSTFGYSRGLEAMTRVGWEHRDRNRQWVRSAVFGAQNLQRMGGFQDENITRVASESVSQLTRIIAGENATYDFREAMGVYQGDRELTELLNRAVKS
mmetsp:Transcript_20493/g.31253  ORF Transcript_20493/g.31253 Transcript_20493/m.31253 type:complete len:247 (-) Transcript_20493:25-765(-)